MRRKTIRSLMLAGVTFIDPSNAYIGAGAQIGCDCVIHPDVVIEGHTVIGENCVIRSGSRISNSSIGDNVVIKDHCLILDSTVESNCSVGPFAHLRVGTYLEEGSAVGNFVEVKKSRLGRKSKSMHLTSGRCNIAHKLYWRRHCYLQLRRQVKHPTYSQPVRLALLHAVAPVSLAMVQLLRPDR